MFLVHGMLLAHDSLHTAGHMDCELPQIAALLPMNGLRGLVGGPDSPPSVLSTLSFPYRLSGLACDPTLTLKKKDGGKGESQCFWEQKMDHSVWRDI